MNWKTNLGSWDCPYFDYKYLPMRIYSGGRHFKAMLTK